MTTTEEHLQVTTTKRGFDRGHVEGAQKIFEH